MRKLKCGLFAVLVLGCAGLFGAVGYLQQAMPDSYTVARGTSLHIGSLVQSRPLDRTVSAAAETG